MLEGMDAACGSPVGDSAWRPSGLAPWQTRIHSDGTADRRDAEAYLEETYARTFDGRIRGHFPNLMSVRDAGGAVQAAVGFRFADEGPLFLEQYLDEPVEQAIARNVGAPVSRGQIAEIGNLAADNHEASLFIFAALARRLKVQGGAYAVATATRQLRRRFRRIGIATQSLGAADPGRLPSGAAEWGSYYARNPEVLAGAIGQVLPGCATVLAPRRCRAAAQ